MPLRRIMKSQPSELLAAKGLLHQDWDALTSCQRECTTRLGMAIQVEQEAYLTQHPELRAVVALYISKMTSTMRKKSDILKETSEFFLRDPAEVESEIRNVLGIPPNVPFTENGKPVFDYFDRDLERDLLQITNKHFAPPPWRIPTPEVYTPDTLSSSFISILTSDTTLPTPEPIPTPTPTVSEIMFKMVSATVDKAIFARVDEQLILYDTAYVELSKAVETAMEIPVTEIKEDIVNLFLEAYNKFENNIIEKERIAAEIAWEKRMRKKMKRTIRREENFKGYVTPPTPKSEISSHESYRRPPPRPCKCHPQIRYNRYTKDRFGIYLPVGEYPGNNVTVTPVLSIDSEESDEEEEEGPTDTKSAFSGKSSFSTKSGLSGKSKKSSGKNVKTEGNLLAMDSSATALHSGRGGKPTVRNEDI